MFTPEAVAGYAVTAIFTIINLLVTYFILKRFLFKPILKVLRKRRLEVENELAGAAEKLADADDRLAKAHERLDNSTHEAASIVNNARAQAETESESILSEARQEASQMLSRADADVARLRVTMLNEVRDEVADLSVAIASKVIGQIMDDKRHRDMVDQLLDEQIKKVSAPEAHGEVTPHA